MRQTHLGTWWVLGLGTLAAFVVMGAGRLRAGGYLFAAVLALAALMRATLPATGRDGLAVRPRALDVVLYLAAAAAVGTATFLLKIPG